MPLLPAQPPVVQPHSQPHASSLLAARRCCRHLGELVLVTVLRGSHATATRVPRPPGWTLLLSLLADGPVLSPEIMAGHSRIQGRSLQPSSLDPAPVCVAGGDRGHGGARNHRAPWWASFLSLAAAQHVSERPEQVR